VANALNRVLRLAERPDAAYVRRDSIPAATVAELDQLVAWGVLREASPADEIDVDCCDGGCSVTADFEEHPATGEQVVLHRCGNGGGLIELKPERFARWTLDLHGLAVHIGRSAGLEGHVIEDQPGRVAVAGAASSLTGPRQVFIVRGAKWSDGDAVLSSPRLRSAGAPVVLTLASLMAPDDFPGYRPSVAALVDLARVRAGNVLLDLNEVLNRTTTPHPDAKVERWISHKEASALLLEVVSGIDLARAQARVSKAVGEGAFHTNGLKRTQLRIDYGSFMGWRREEQQRDLAKADAAVVTRRTRGTRYGSPMRGSRG